MLQPLPQPANFYLRKMRGSLRKLRRNLLISFANYGLRHRQSEQASSLSESLVCEFINKPPRYEEKLQFTV
uniref:Uncharacterized protein n=1 Tax=Tupiella akineta TaxID=160070 RepID=Q6UVQ8_TUPAK|nr:hypothetical protein PsakpMp53 [Tupiella akineta]AAQ18766.1 hypothetical protein [Tupiella akineta]